MRERMIRRHTPHNRINVYPEENKFTAIFGEEDIREYNVSEVSVLQADIQAMQKTINAEMSAMREKARNIQEVETDLMMAYKYILELHRREQ